MKASHRPIVVVLAVFTTVMMVMGVSRWMTPKELVPWRSDFAAARAEARASGKPVFAYFTAAWCGPCQSLKTTTWADPDVARALSAYVPARIDIDLDVPSAERYDAFTIPKFAVLDGEGKVVKSTEGYLDPHEFMKWLEE